MGGIAMRFVHLLQIACVAAASDRRFGDVTTSTPGARNEPKSLPRNDRIAIMKKLFIGTALAALVGNPVLAADMLVKAPAAPTYSWEGLYVGGNVGWLGIEGVSLSGTPADDATVALLGPCTGAGACPTSIGSALGSSVSGGGQFGFNWQIQNWVVGLETDAQAARATASSSANVNVPSFGPYFANQSIKETGFGTVRARAGLLVTPNVLAYVTGGFAWAQTNQSVTAGFPLLSETANGGATNTAVGGTVGAGLEWALGNRWSVAGEYLYARLGATSLSFQTAPLGAGCSPGGVASCQFNVSESSFSNNIVRLKINYKIN
jgi:outer membrane immunogenic protein